jgi:hypothetical protein
VDARILAGVDLAVAAGLLVPVVRPAGCLLLLGMTAASTVAVLRDPSRSCGCFGRGGTAPWREHAARAVTAAQAVLLLGLVMADGERGRSGFVGLAVGLAGLVTLVALQPQLLPWRPVDRLGLPEALRAIRLVEHPDGLEPPLRTARPRSMNQDGDRWLAVFDATLDGRPVTVEAELTRGPATLRITP